MPYLALLVTAVVLGIFVAPALSTRREINPAAEDEFASSHVLPKVIQNSQIVYAIGLVALGVPLGPFFAQGGDGGLWRAIIAAACVGLGLSLIYVLRRPVLKFMADRMGGAGSITVHGFIARQHDNDLRVGAVAAALTICALSGFMVCVALGVAALLKPMLGDYSGLTDVVIAAVLAVTLACTMLSGPTGIMHASQLQLGLLYLGLFGSIPLLLYQQVSELGLFPVRGNIAVALIAVVCAVMLFYRRGRYVDSSSLRSGRPDRESVPLRVLRRFQKILNASISVVIGTTLGASLFLLGVTAYLLYGEGLPTLEWAGASALHSGANVSDMGMLSVVLLALFHPLVDIVNWQRLAVFAGERDWNYFGEGQWTTAFKSFCSTYAVEVPLVALLICLFGTLAGLTLKAAGHADAVGAFVGQLIEQDNLVATAVLLCLLFGLFAVAVATISALYAASLDALRRDIVPALWRPGPPVAPASVGGKARGRRWTAAAGAGTGLVVFAAYALAARSETSFGGAGFLAVAVGLGCLQLSFAPLVFGPLIAGSDIEPGAAGIVSPGWALAVMGAGAATGGGATVAYLSTGYDPLQWAAVPSCLGSGALVFVIARLRLRRTTSVGRAH